VAIESGLGAIRTLTMTDLGRKIQLRTGEEKAHSYLAQQISVVVKRGNSVSIRPHQAVF
jgi:hypothetical protein